MTNERPTFTAVGITLVKCDINPLECPVRKIRENAYLAKIQQFMCTHDDAPRVADETLRLGGFNYRSCITKPKIKS